MNIFENWTQYQYEREDIHQSAISTNAQLLIDHFDEHGDPKAIAKMVEAIPPLKQKVIAQVLYEGDDEIVLELEDGHALKICWGKDMMPSDEITVIQSTGDIPNDMPTVFDKGDLGTGKWVETEKIIPLTHIENPPQMGYGKTIQKDDNLLDDIMELLDWIRMNRKTVFKATNSFEDRVDLIHSNAPDPYSMSGRQRINFIESFLQLLNSVGPEAFLVDPSSMGVLERNPDVFVFFNT
jgi:hypothetical protein